MTTDYARGYRAGIEAATEKVRCGIAITQAAMDRNGPDRWAYAVDALKDALEAIEDLKRPEPTEPSEEMVERLSAWWRSWDTGLSSEAIALFLGMGVKSEHTPSDSADLGRCLRLLDKVPEWQPRFPEMRNAGGAWPFIVDRWDELEQHYKIENWDAVYEVLNAAHREHHAALAAAGGE